MVEIELAAASQRKIKAYAKTKGITVNQANCEGLEEWWDLLGIIVSPEPDAKTLRPNA